jgi:NTE family protein
MELTDLVSPVSQDMLEDAPGSPSAGVALCLSGGGYRAMLFHLGTLWRLNEAGYLAKLDWVSSVSGGSITAGVLGAAWSRLEFDDAGVSRRFHSEVTVPIRRLAGKTIDIGAILMGLLGRGTASDRLAGAYRKHLFPDLTLQDLPADDDGPRFVINASNLQSGVLWRFSRPYARDWRVGMIRNPTIDLATAVAASSAFPPFVSPLILDLDETLFEPKAGEDLQRPPYTTRIHLTDGGVYDNLGLETAWKRHRVVLVSDGGGELAPHADPGRDWPRHVLRVLNVIDHQVRSLRKRQLIASFRLPPGNQDHRLGAYWGIRTDIADYELPDALPCPHDRTLKLAETPTRLRRLDGASQERLINWGYAVCDAAMRKHVDPALPRPAAFPYPDRGVG